MDRQDVEREETEQIPWAMLAEEMRDDPRRRNIVVATAVVGVLAALVAFVWFRRPPGVTVEVPASPATVAALPDPAATPAGTLAPPGTLAEPPGPLPEPAAAAGERGSGVLYTEADLMAVMPEHEMRLVAAHAEVVVADHFTVDGYAADDGAPAGAYAWVEWSRAAAVEVGDRGGYQVTVMFRTIARPDAESPLQRSPVRAVTVPLALAADGSLAVTDLPTPVDPTPVADAFPAAGDEEIPDEVTAEVAARLTALGYDRVSFLGGSHEGEAWRVTVEAGDGTGPSWPMVVQVDS